MSLHVNATRYSKGAFILERKRKRYRFQSVAFILLCVSKKQFASPFALV